MHLYDLTHPITETAPVWPGTEPPRLRLRSTYEHDGYQETELRIFSHTGTHADAPAHIFPGFLTLDQLPPDRLVGSAAVVDCTGCGKEIGLELLEALSDREKAADFFLLFTGWEQKWDSAAYFSGFPCLTPEAAELLARAGKKGVGIDAISIDPMESADLTVHRILLGGNRMIVLENLCGLEALVGKTVELFVCPLKFAGADGAPARVLARVPDDKPNG